MKKPQTPRRYSWRCWLCTAWDSCDTGLLALAGWQKHYSSTHLEKP